MELKKTAFFTDSNLRRIATSSRACSCSALLLSFFVLTVVVEHALQPGLTPSDHRVSEYANTPSGWLLTAGFVAWSASLLAAAVVARPFRHGSRVLALGLRTDS